MLMDGKLQRQQVQKLKSELYTDENGIIDEEQFQQDSKQLKVGMLASVEDIFKELAKIKDKRSKLILKDLLKTCTNLWGSGKMKKVIKLNDLLPTCYDVNKYYGFQVDNGKCSLFIFYTYLVGTYNNDIFYGNVPLNVWILITDIVYFKYVCDFFGSLYIFEL
ncbi:uncharacterized protein LOC107883720 [Acyrthosiphon pisum]|uniref:EF-hand domain-containing protein n=1 Tax=Acyrthosiphon pisum TaxID=7029 RepID=A0A8R2JRP2_ACYPI|nr:uncharacterized protein LOC107883720 [Acyrthosiphon pisum]